MGYWVYVLRSLKANKRYVGYSSKDPNDRLREHNLGSNKWTRLNKPFVLIHKEPFDDKTDAIRREKFLKSGQGRNWLDNNVPR